MPTDSGSTSSGRRGRVNAGSAGAGRVIRGRAEVWTGARAGAGRR